MSTDGDRAVCPVCDKVPHTPSEQRRCMRVVNGWIREARKDENAQCIGQTDVFSQLAEVTE